MPEEPYEMVDFSPAVKNVRTEKEAAHGKFKSELFKGNLCSFSSISYSYMVIFSHSYNVLIVMFGLFIFGPFTYLSIQLLKGYFEKMYITYPPLLQNVLAPIPTTTTVDRII